MGNVTRKFVLVRKGLLPAALIFASIGSTYVDSQESSIFSFDGQDFTRIHTTLVTEEGVKAFGTKLDHKSPAYPLLLKKQSYTGPTTLFGQSCNANYAPLTNASGQLTGAIFVALCRTKNDVANSNG